MDIRAAVVDRSEEKRCTLRALGGSAEYSSKNFRLKRLLTVLDLEIFASTYLYRDRESPIY